MANKVIFSGSDGIKNEMDRDQLETWYMEFNPFDVWDHDRLENDLKKTPLKELVKLYYEFEKEMDGNYEIIKDLQDNDIADRLIREIRYITDDLRWMISAENLGNFLKELIKKTQAS